MRRNRPHAAHAIAGHVLENSLAAGTSIFHYWLYYWTSFTAVLVLMLLAFWEQSAVPSIENDLEDKAVRGTIAGAICLMILWYCTIQVYITLEMVLLLFIGVSLVLKLVWRGPIVFLKSRNVLTVSTCMAPCMSIHTLSWLPQVLILLVMFAEALAILSRNQRHFRITRALRPYFLLDTYLMAGARRYFVEHQTVHHVSMSSYITTQDCETDH